MPAPNPMKAVEITAPGGPDVLALVDRPRPEPGANEVLIKIHAAGVNRPEVLQRMGLYPPPPGATDVPGLECAGEVAALGPGADAFQIGDRVCALLPGGSYAEYAVVDQGAVLPVPKRLSMVEAAGLPETYFTVWANVFDDAALKEGETLLVHGGTSGIGATAIALGKAIGARVFATAGSAEKCAAAEKLGADRCFNYKEDAFETLIAEDGGADVVLDMAGGDFVPRNIAALNPGGRLVWIAFLRGMTAEVDIMAVMRKRLRLSGSTMKARDAAEKARLAKGLRETVWPLLEAGKIKPVIDATFPLEDVTAAHARMEAGDHVGKIVLTVVN